MTTTPHVSTPAQVRPRTTDTEEETPRYAAQRMLAAQLGRLPQRILTRAHSESLAHHRRLAAANEQQ